MISSPVMRDRGQPRWHGITEPASREGEECSHACSQRAYIVATHIHGWQNGPHRISCASGECTGLKRESAMMSAPAPVQKEINKVSLLSLNQKRKKGITINSVARTPFLP